MTWFRTHLACALLIASCLAVATACSTAGDTWPDLQGEAARIITNEDLDEVPEWAVAPKARCLIGDADACAEVARNESPEERRRRREAEAEDRRCGQSHIPQYRRPDCDEYLEKKFSLRTGELGTLAAEETAQQRAERLKREREQERAQRREQARKHRWYHRALAAQLRRCGRGTRSSSECRKEAIEDMRYYVGVPLTLELQAEFDAETDRHRAIMKDACKKEGRSTSCWDWFTTHEVDEGATSSGKFDVLVRALEFGSQDAWAFVWDDIAAQESPGADPKRLAAAKKRRRKASLVVRDEVFELAGSMADSLDGVPSLLRMACESGDMGSCYQNIPPTVLRAGAGDALHDKYVGRVHASARSRCMSKKKDARACWVAGYIAHRHGVGVEEASTSYERGCKLGETRACEGLGVMRFEQDDEEGAAPWLERSCDSKTPRGCALLGLMAATGRGATRDPARARALLTKACASNDETSDGWDAVCRPPEHTNP